MYFLLKFFDALDNTEFDKLIITLIQQCMRTTLKGKQIIYSVNLGKPKTCFTFFQGTLH